MIKNYIFDFGCVLANFSPEEFTRKFVKDEENVSLVRDVVFSRDFWGPLDQGTITDEEVKKGIKERLPDNLHEKACKIYNSWIELLTPISGMEELIRDLKKKGGKIYLLSNISKGFAENYHKFPWINNLFSLFDGLVFSGTIGIVKPYPEIFNYILSKYNLKADESIFIDDYHGNIEGCENAGIKGYLFDGDSEVLRKYLFSLDLS